MPTPPQSDRRFLGPKRPNVLLVTFDQWRADHLKALGCPLPITPNVDALAAGGVTFAKHHTATAPCGPSRTSMLTGRYLMGHRVVNNGTPLTAELATLPRLMTDAGYDPVLFGYTDTTLDPRLLTANDPRRTSWEQPMPGFRAGAGEVCRCKDSSSTASFARAHDAGRTGRMA